MRKIFKKLLLFLVVANSVTNYENEKRKPSIQGEKRGLKQKCREESGVNLSDEWEFLKRRLFRKKFESFSFGMMYRRSILCKNSHP